MSGYTAADMTTARAKGYRDASEGTAQEAVAIHVNAVDSDGSLLYVHPPIAKRGDTLYLAIPVAAAPVDDGMLPDALVPHSNEWYTLCERRFAVDKIKISGDLACAIVDAICQRPESTPAAPGIDLRVRELLARRLRQWRTHLPADPAKPGIRAIRTYDHPGLEGETDYNNDVAIWREACSVLDEALTLIDASPKGGSDGEPMFYIQDTRSFVGNCPVWWAPRGSGYVTRLDEAGRFTEHEAIAQNRTRDTDVPWPCAEIDKLGRITVDMQHMRPRRERLAELATSAEVGA